MPQMSRLAMFTCINCSEWLTGNALSITESIRLKIAVFAPIPSASVKTTVIENPGLFRSVLVDAAHHMDS